MTVLVYKKKSEIFCGIQKVNLKSKYIHYVYKEKFISPIAYTYIFSEKNFFKQEKCSLTWKKIISPLLPCNNKSEMILKVF